MMKGKLHIFFPLQTDSYIYYNTDLDNKDHLNYETSQKTSEVAVVAAQVAGQMALRLVHDHLLKLDTSRYGSVVTKAVAQVTTHLLQLSKVCTYVSVSRRVLADMYMSFVLRVLQSGQLKEVNPVWLARARGSFQRAVTDIKSEIYNTDLTDQEACRILNDRIMRVRKTLQLLALFSVLQQGQSVE